MSLDIKVYFGKGFLEYIDFLSNLRIKTFKDYPYLYEGTTEIESEYCASYAQDERSMLIIAKIDNEIAGICTGTPLSNAGISKNIEKILLERDYNIDDYYYCGE